MKRKYIRYTGAQLQWIKANRTMTRRELHDGFVKRFDRRDVTLDHIKALCTRRGWKTGRDGCFKPGAVPANKGKKMPYNANSARTQFKKGQVPRNTKYLGHERVSKDGYVEISIAETNPHTGFHRRYVLKHRYLWEQKNGKVPNGMCLKAMDGNRQNTDPDNWELIPRGVNARLNGRWSPRLEEVAPELRPTVLTLAKLKQGVKEKSRPKSFKTAPGPADPRG